MNNVLGSVLLYFFSSPTLLFVCFIFSVFLAVVFGIAGFMKVGQ